MALTIVLITPFFDAYHLFYHSPDLFTIDVFDHAKLLFHKMEPHSYETMSMPVSPAKMERMNKRRVPPEKRQRTEMSCDYCKAKRCKCSRSSLTEPCRACLELTQQCKTTQSRRQRGHIARDTHHSAGIAAPAIPRAPRVYPSEFVDVQVGCTVLLRPKATAAEYLFEDPLGLPRYIGATGSFTLLMRLREIMATQFPSETGSSVYAQTMGQSVQVRGATEVPLHLPPRSIADALVDIYFSKVNSDYPLFHRALFEAKYEMVWSTTPDLEPSWLMTLYMVFVLAMTTASKESLPSTMQAQKDLLKEQFLSRVKPLLPDVLSGSSLVHVQALMVYCLYLHISRQRNACWNITGSAIRIAVAIGLHRNGASKKCTMLERELRKRVWWTLFFFERIECSSLGRPSAIDDAQSNVDLPADGFLDMGDHLPLGYLDVQASLLQILGQICKEQSNLEHLTGKHGELGRLMTEKLDQWHRNLPPHLRLDAPLPPTHQRPVFLLHIQFQYTIAILTRPYLIAKASSKGSMDSPQTNFYARKCVVAATSSVELLQKLFMSGKFNAKTWWDVFFIESASMILGMGKMIEDQELFRDVNNLVDSLKTCLNILAQCGELSPTMQRFANVTSDFAQVLVLAADSQRLKRQNEISAEGEVCPSPLDNPHDLTTGRDYCSDRLNRVVYDALLDHFSGLEDPGDYPMPTNWDDPLSWLPQQ